MKLEKLDYGKGSKRKYFLYGFIMCALLLILLNMFTSKAKYKQVEKIELIRQNVSYSAADLNIIGVYVKAEGQEKYTKQDDIPQIGYKLNKKDSYCTISNNPDQLKGIIDYKAGKITVETSKRNTKCYLYFEEHQIKNAADLLSDLKNKSKGDIGNSFTGAACAGTTENAADCVDKTNNGHIYSTSDDYGTSYYFRGSGEDVEKNWVKIGNMYWRIIRINGNGTIRLIYNGITTATTGAVTLYKTGVAFNSTYNDNKYVGLMYGGSNKTATSTSYTDAHTNTYKSTILESLESFYTSNLQQYAQILDGETGFCGDREKTSGNGYGGYGNASDTKYAAYTRLFIFGNNPQSPTLKCTNKDRDLYTIKGSSQGNKALPVPVGLITADEIVFAGGIYGANNQEFWLYNNQKYWTMTPCNYSGSSNYALVYEVDSSGFLTNDWVYNNIAMGVRPVINLKANIEFELDGEGTSDNPFVVKTN